MVLVYVPPSSSMPLDEADFGSTWWYAVWDRPLRPTQLPRPGDTVFLASPDGVVRWETEVITAVAVPYEHPDAFLDHMSLQYGTPAGPVVGSAPIPGFGLAWSAAPVRALAIDTGTLGVDCPHWASGDDLDPVLAAALGLGPQVV